MLFYFYEENGKYGVHVTFEQNKEYYCKNIEFVYIWGLELLIKIQFVG